MSYRNGDKSRENRLRKAREKKREKIRDIKGEPAKAAAPKK
jgi:hypothetical protein